MAFSFQRLKRFFEIMQRMNLQLYVFSKKAYLFFFFIEYESKLLMEQKQKYRITYCFAVFIKAVKYSLHSFHCTKTYDQFKEL